MRGVGINLRSMAMLSAWHSGRDAPRLEHKDEDASGLLPLTAPTWSMVRCHELDAGHYEGGLAARIDTPVHALVPEEGLDAPDAARGRRGSCSGVSPFEESAKFGSRRSEMNSEEELDVVD